MPRSQRHRSSTFTPMPSSKLSSSSGARVTRSSFSPLRPTPTCQVEDDALAEAFLGGLRGYLETWPEITGREPLTIPAATLRRNEHFHGARALYLNDADALVKALVDADLTHPSASGVGYKVAAQTVAAALEGDFDHSASASARPTVIRSMQRPSARRHASPPPSRQSRRLQVGVPAAGSSTSSQPALGGAPAGMATGASHRDSMVGSALRGVERAGTAPMPPRRSRQRCHAVWKFCRTAGGILVTLVGALVGAIKSTDWGYQIYQVKHELGVLNRSITAVSELWDEGASVARRVRVPDLFGDISLSVPEAVEPLPASPQGGDDQAEAREADAATPPMAQAAPQSIVQPMVQAGATPHAALPAKPPQPESPEQVPTDVGLCVRGLCGRATVTQTEALAVFACVLHELESQLDENYGATQLDVPSLSWSLEELRARLPEIVPEVHWHERLLCYLACAVPC